MSGTPVVDYEEFMRKVTGMKRRELEAATRLSQIYEAASPTWDIYGLDPSDDCKDAIAEDWKTLGKAFLRDHNILIKGISEL